MLSAKSAQQGVTLIELMIGLVVVGILFGLALPSYQQWIQNTQIRTAAESIQNGLQLARGAAVTRNDQVQFVFTDTSPIQANVNTIVASAAGRNWMVRRFQAGGNYTAADFVQGRSRGEGSSNAVIAVTAAGAGQSSVTFNGLGRLAAPTVNITVDITNPAGGDRPLRVLVSPNGQIRMCDPAVNLATDPRGCV